MNFIDIVRRSIRSLLGARGRTLLTALAIAVGAFALSLTLAASNGATKYADAIINDNFDPSELIVSADKDLFTVSDTSKPQEYNPNFSSVVSTAGNARQVESLDETDIATLRNVEGVASVRTSSTAALQYITRDGQRQYTATVEGYNANQPPELLAGTLGSSMPDKTIVVPEGFLGALGFSSPKQAIGQKVRLAVQQPVDQSAALNSFLQNGSLSALSNQNEAVETEYTVIAVSKAPSVQLQPAAALYLTVNQQAVAAIKDAATVGTSNYRKYISVFVKVTDGTDRAKLQAVQDRISNLGYGAQSIVDTQKTITQVITVLQGIVLIFGLIAVIASIFGVVNTMYISVLQRTREIGLMKALGMHKGSINQLFLFEAALIGFLGGVIGSIIALVAGTALNPTISKLLNIGDTQLLDFHIPQLILLVLILTFVAMLAGYFPARKAANLDPIEALRTE